MALAGAVRPSAILACEAGPDALLVAERIGAPLVGLESLIGRRELWTNASLGRLAALVPAAGPATAVLYAASDGWERAADASRGALACVAPPRRLKERLDDKIAVRAALRALGVPVPDSEVADTRALLGGGPGRRLGFPLVVQRPVGSAGIGTAIVTDRGALSASLPHPDADPGPWLVSRHTGATTLNVHGLVSPWGSVAYAPSVQITGAPELARDTATYCGNDFGAVSRHPPGLRAAIRAHTLTVAHWLGRTGWRGLFGLDLTWDGATARVIELNPRMQGSTALLDQLEALAGGIPASLAHLAAWSPRPTEGAGSPPAETLTGAHAVLHSEAPDDVLPAGAPAPGAHVLGSDGTLVFRRPAVSLGELADEEILLAGLPPAGVPVAPGAVLARIAVRGGLAAADGRTLSPRGRAVVAAVRGALQA